MQRDLFWHRQSGDTCPFFKIIIINYVYVQELPLLIQFTYKVIRPYSVSVFLHT